MATSNGVDATINKIETAFEGFEKDSLPIEQQDEFLRRREDLRNRVYELYAEFDSTAWWWARNIYDQARILHLISPARLDKLNEHIGQYNNNLVETAHAIDIPWHAYLGTNAVTHGSGAKEIMPSLNKQLRNLQQQGPNHPGLHTHRYQSVPGPGGSALWESYVENRTPSARRMWWIYGPADDAITIVTIGPHP